MRKIKQSINYFLISVRFFLFVLLVASPFLIAELCPGICQVQAAEVGKGQKETPAAEEFEIEKDRLVRYYGPGGDVVIPEGIKIIGEAAFIKNKTIRSIVIPEGVKKIEGRVFQGCTNLEHVKLPNSLQKIGYSAFSGCKKLERLEIPEQVTYIGNAAFYRCVKLAEIKIPSTVANPGAEQTFLDTPWMEQQMEQMPKETPFLIVNDVLIYAEKERNGKIKVPDGVKKIADWAFSYSLYTQIVLPDSLKEIGHAAFYSCKNLTELSLPKNLTRLGSSSFAGCTELKEMAVSDSVKELECCVFSGATSLYSVTLPAKMKKIGESAFFGCKELKEIKLPASLQTIEDGAFSACTKLKKVVIPDSVVSIGRNVFSSCTSLSQIILPAGLKDLGDVSTYENTPWLEEKMSAMTDQAPYLIINRTLLVGKKGVKTAITLPDSVTRIAGYAFHDTSFTKIIIPDSVTEMGDNIFCLCGVEEVYIPDSVTVFGADMFEKCYQLKKVRLSNSIKIMSFTFYDCWKLKEVELPENLKKIQFGFAGCPRLKKVILHAKLTDIDLFSSTLPKNVVLYVDQGSAAEQYAKKEKLPYQYNASVKTYMVKKGDSLWQIAQKYLGDGSRYPEIVKLNQLGKNGIRVGQKIKLPKK